MKFAKPFSSICLIFAMAVMPAIAGEDFAFDLYRKASAADDGNFVISPYSVKMAVGMAASGATGETFSQMVDAIDLAATNGTSLVGLLAKDKSALLSATNKATVIETTDSLWPIVDRGFNLKKDFVSRLKRELAAEVRSTSISNGQAEINSFVDKATYGRIPKLLESPLDPSTELVILNTIYFNGKWDSPFLKEATSKDSFFVDGKELAVSFMNKSGRYPFYGSSDYSVVSIPYTRGESGMEPFEMMVILPSVSNSIETLEETLTTKKLIELREKAMACKVALAIPKFAFDATIPLNEPLMALGIKRAFAAGEFGGIADGNLAISEVLQKATVEVDESGTVASAATSIMISRTSLAPPPRPFVANRPFLFVVWHPTTKEVLFVGRVKNPQPCKR